jgi:hypothetical protein
MAGCSLPTSGYSRYCDTHKRRNRRHGHPAQSPVTTSELAAYRERIQKRIEKNRENPAWDMLRQRWSAILAHAEGQLSKFHAGTPMNRYEIDAWHNLKKIGESASETEVIETVLAMYLCEDANPYRFKSHEAFGSQLVRRVRALAPTNVGSYYDHETRTSKRVYRDAKPKTVTIMADILQRTFGATGVALARLEKQDAEKKQAEQKTLHDALDALV